jgi:hypothetical protein
MVSRLNPLGVVELAGPHPLAASAIKTNPPRISRFAIVRTTASLEFIL